MKPILVFDLEVYKNYLLVAFKNIATGNVVCFERTEDQDLDIAKLYRILSAYTLVGFNSNHFDLPVLAMAMTGASNADIKAVCDDIIVGGKKSWEIYRERNLTQFDELDHIDIIEVAPGFIGLKQYGGRLHAQTLQDLPIEPGASIAMEERQLLCQYCANDLALTQQLYEHLLPQIDLRRSMTAEHGIDLRSKSDAQMAEAIIKSEVEARRNGKKVPKAQPLEPKTKLAFTPPDWVAFKTWKLQEIFGTMCDADYRVDQWGAPVMPSTMEDATVTIGDSVYRIGMGGLHSSEASAVHEADENTILVDRDVASYYPSIIINSGLYPPNMGEDFLAVYRNIVDRRLAAKRNKDMVTADALKICVNGSFGKLGSKWSILYAPALMLRVTLTGQLALLMLIERLEYHDIPVVSANTDGVVIKCPVSKIAEMDAIVDWWETTTGFVTEDTHYSGLYSRDVNNYVAIKTDGKVKTKGVYAGTSLAKSPQNEICIEAVIAHLTSGTPIETTIATCKDIRKFLTLRQVKGGALFDGKYLGKVVRWYYGKGPTGYIEYKTNGNKVARSEGAVPCMVLPEGFPVGIDRDWYIREAISMLTDLGVDHDYHITKQNEWWPQLELAA